MDISADEPRDHAGRPVSTSQDQWARARIERVANAFLKLFGKQDARIKALEERLADVEQEQERTRG